MIGESMIEENTTIFEKEPAEKTAAASEYVKRADIVVRD